MDALIATHVRSFDELKGQAARLETYNAEGRWLVVGEDSPAARAFLKAWSVKRQVTAFFLPLNLARKISPVAFSGPGGALNAALLCSALTETPVLIFRNGASPVSKETAALLETEADTVTGCCTGYSRNPHAWIKHAKKSLEAWKAGIISKELCRKQVQEAFSGNAFSEKTVCTDSLAVFPQAAEKVCFSPKTEQAILLWVDVAERMGLCVQEGKRPWSAHAPRPDELGTLNTVLQEYENLETIAHAVEYVFQKSSFRTYSDYLLDEACQDALNEKKNPAVLPETLDAIGKLKDKALTLAAESLQPAQPDKKALREEGRAFFASLKAWPQIVQAAREKEVVRFVE